MQAKKNRREAVGFVRAGASLDFVVVVALAERVAAVCRHKRRALSVDPRRDLPAGRACDDRQPVGLWQSVFCFLCS